jgi:hypothetical protein
VKRVYEGSFTVTTGLKRTHGNQNADDESPLLSTTHLLAFGPLTFSTYLPTYLSDLPFRLTFPTYLSDLPFRLTFPTYLSDLPLAYLPLADLP